MKFVFRSLLILVALYGLVFAVADVYLIRSGLPVLWASRSPSSSSGCSTLSPRS